jgi:hypothetical protein
MPYYENQSTWGRVKLPLQQIESPNQYQRERNHYFENEGRALRYALMQEHRKFPDSHSPQRDDCPVCHPGLENPGPGRVIDSDVDDAASIDELLADVELDENSETDAEDLLAEMETQESVE